MFDAGHLLELKYLRAIAEDATAMACQVTLPG
jgi:hypothetical protein